MPLLMQQERAYLATLIEKGINEIESYSNNPADIEKDMVIRPSLPNKN